MFIPKYNYNGYVTLLKGLRLKNVLESLRKANSVLLTTHRDPDGDGLGSEMALYHALKKINKEVSVCHVDPLPKKYHGLIDRNLVSTYTPDNKLQTFDLALVFDTNDERLTEPLFSALTKKSTEIIFIDHHPLLKKGPVPQKFYIDQKAASTGEVTYSLIKELKIPMDAQIAKYLYTSIVFDTQLFRYIRSSPASHEIVLQLLPWIENPELIHRKLFGGQTPEKMELLSRALGRVKYYDQNRIAIIHLLHDDLTELGLTIEETRDVVDKIIDIECVEVAVLFREDINQKFKISFRSKKNIDVLGISEKFGGGGHYHASGASIQGTFSDLNKQVIDFLSDLLSKNL